MSDERRQKEEEKKNSQYHRHKGWYGLLWTGIRSIVVRFPMDRDVESMSSTSITHKRSKHFSSIEKATLFCLYSMTAFSSRRHEMP